MGNTLAPTQRELDLMNGKSARSAKEILDRLEGSYRPFLRQDWVYIVSTATYHIGLTFDILAVTMRMISTSSLSTRCSTSIPTSASRKSPTPFFWTNEVQETVKEFSTGPIADGLSSVATNTINKMLNSTAGRRQIQQR